MKGSSQPPARPAEQLCALPWLHLHPGAVRKRVAPCAEPAGEGSTGAQGQCQRRRIWPVPGWARAGLWQRRYDGQGVAVGRPPGGCGDGRSQPRWVAAGLRRGRRCHHPVGGSSAVTTALARWLTKRFCAKIPPCVGVLGGHRTRFDSLEKEGDRGKAHQS